MAPDVGLRFAKPRQRPPLLRLTRTPVISNRQVISAELDAWHALLLHLGETLLGHVTRLVGVGVAFEFHAAEIQRALLADVLVAHAGVGADGEVPEVLAVGAVGALAVVRETGAGPRVGDRLRRLDLVAAVGRRVVAGNVFQQVSERAAIAGVARVDADLAAVSAAGRVAAFPQFHAIADAVGFELHRLVLQIHAHQLADRVHGPMEAGDALQAVLVGRVVVLPGHLLEAEDLARHARDQRVLHGGVDHMPDAVLQARHLRRRALDARPLRPGEPIDEIHRRLRLRVQFLQHADIRRHLVLDDIRSHLTDAFLRNGVPNFFGAVGYGVTHITDGLGDLAAHIGRVLQGRVDDVVEQRADGVAHGRRLKGLP